MSSMTPGPATRPAPSGDQGLLWSRAPLAPAPALYVTRDDRLLIRSLGSVAAVVEVRARLQVADGQVVPLRFTHTPSSSRAFVSTIHELTEGVLLSVAAEPSAGTVERGEVFVSVSLLRGTLADNDSAAVLFADYLLGSLPRGWPPGRVLSSVEGPGVMLAVSGVAPADGNDPTLSVPAGARWRVVSLFATLATGATAANRRPAVRLRVAPTPTLAYQAPALSDQAASLTVAYSAGAATAGQVVGAGASLLPLPAAALLPGESVIDFATLNIQTDDRWSAIDALVEEWAELGTAS